MELFLGVGGTIVAVNPSMVSHVKLLRALGAMQIYIHGYCQDGLEYLRPLEGETLDEAWARLTRPPAVSRV